MDNSIDFNDVDTLVLCGGGVHGIAYLGVLETLFLQHGFETFPMGQRNPRITNVCGVSVGALIGFLIALGFDSFAEAHALVDRILQTLVDGVDLVSFARDWGGNDGKGLRGLLRSRATKRVGTGSPTFEQLLAKTGVRLRVNATDLCACEPCYFSPEETPDADVIDAVYGSMALPPLFAPRQLGDRLLVDGGLMENVPRIPGEVTMERCLVLAMPPRGSEVRQDVSKIQDYVYRLVLCTMRSRVQGDEDRLFKLSKRTILVDCCDIAPAFSFAISDRIKKSLLLRGLEAAQAFTAAKDTVVPCSRSRSVGVQTD